RCLIVDVVLVYVFFFFFFFFQAEDGIRDYKVTGVQTCALPISAAGRPEARPGRRPRAGPRAAGGRRRPGPAGAGRTARPRRCRRSEERRVGKEGRSGWGAEC